MPSPSRSKKSTCCTTARVSLTHSRPQHALCVPAAAPCDPRARFRGWAWGSRATARCSCAADLRAGTQAATTQSDVGFCMLLLCDRDRAPGLGTTRENSSSGSGRAAHACAFVSGGCTTLRTRLPSGPTARSAKPNLRNRKAMVQSVRHARRRRSCPRGRAHRGPARRVAQARGQRDPKVADYGV